MTRNWDSKLQSTLRLAIVTVSITGLLGCSSIGKSLRSLVSGKDSNDTSATNAKTANMTKFSDNENVRPTGSDKQYKRMNRQRFEEEADLKADAGSLWIMEGQGAYLFSQNQLRIVGDLLNVKIEGAPRSQLQTKVKVIAKLLDRLENPTQRGLASQGGATPVPGAPAQPGSPAAQPNGANQNNGQAQAGQNPGGADGAENAGTPSAAAKPETPFAVQVVPTRIVEQLRDGSYRVRGMQPFMIGKREYKVIVTGVIRPEDFDEAGVDASRLLDPQFDIVSSKKGLM